MASSAKLHREIGRPTATQGVPQHGDGSPCTLLMAERGSPGANLRALTRSKIVPPCGDRDDHARLARICPKGKWAPPTCLPGQTKRCPASQLLGELARASLSP